MTIALACMTMLTVGAQESGKKSKDHNFEVAKNLDIFNNIYKNLDLMYVDTLNAAEVIGTGINAMLRSLDPYTEYYPEENTKDLKMMLTGKYAGMGALIRYNQKLKRVIVDEPYEGMPAAEAGLRKGDIILSIDDSVMTDKNVSHVSSCLRGDAGTSFILKIKRPSTDKTMDIKITRKSIKLPEIPYYGMRPGRIGYINLNGFPEGCAREMRRAFIDLKKQGAKGLVLDLRGNGGGSLQEAVDIINMWVPRGLTLVETRGKLRQSDHKYKTRLEPVDTVMPIVVLVNGETASASEITAGSLQDLDRGVVMGTRTYGKGLVQSPMIELPYNANLKMTTAKYYIPSGRCIQAINYKHSDGGYRERIADSLTHVFHTRAGREVRDGGGITPDIKVEYPEGNRLVYNIVRDNWSFDFANRYAARHESIPSPEEFEITDTIFNEFKAFIDPAKFNYDRTCELILEQLEKATKTEGYLNDQVQAQLDSLKVSLKHDLNHDLDQNRKTISEYLASEILQRYYFDRGSIIEALKHDAELDSAAAVLNSPERYKAILSGK